MSLAKCSNFSSSSRVHSVFLILGSSHSYQRALHCLADFLTRSDEILAHWFRPYFITAALRISSCTRSFNLATSLTPRRTSLPWCSSESLGSDYVPRQRNCSKKRLLDKNLKISTMPHEMWSSSLGVESSSETSHSCTAIPMTIAP